MCCRSRGPSHRSPGPDLAAQVLRPHRPLEVLVNNAGVYMPNAVETWTAGNDAGLNHSPPFRSRTCYRLARGQRARAGIAVSSVRHFAGEINFDDLNSEKHLRRSTPLFATKLMDVLFGTNWLLGSRDRGDLECLHPGVIDHELLHAASRVSGPRTRRGPPATSVYWRSSRVEDTNGATS